VVVMAMEEFERLKVLELTKAVALADELNHCQAPR
jgi:hypothetical protein